MGRHGYINKEKDVYRKSYKDLQLPNFARNIDSFLRKGSLINLEAKKSKTR